MQIHGKYPGRKQVREVFRVHELMEPQAGLDTQDTKRE